jgi:hypothetical protein
MASVFSTLLRGLLGVIATIAVVAIAWTLYINRTSVIASVEPVVGMFHRQQDATPPVARHETAPAPAATPADAPAPGNSADPDTSAKQ